MDLFDNETKPKSRRGRKPKLKENQDVPDLVIRKKRGRKKKCEMYLDNVEKISGYNPNGESIDTINDSIKFGGVETHDDSQFENISFGLLKIKRHNNVSIEKAAPPKEVNYEKNGECLVNFDIIVDNIPEPKLQSEMKQSRPKPANKETLTGFLNTKTTTSSVLSSKIINYRKKGNDKISVLKDNPPTKIIKVMHHYNGTKRELPKKTDIWCWWCCHPFDTIPRFLPTKYDELRNRFRVTGNFCSWQCVKAYDLDGNNYGSNGKMLLTTLMRTMHGKMYNINPAPPRSVLKVFGGSLSIDDFRNRDENVYYEINTNRITFDTDHYIKEIPSRKKRI